MKRKASDYAGALYEAVKAHPSRVSELVSRFFSLLQTDRNSRLLPCILDAIETIEAQDRHYLVVKVTSAFTLSEAERQMIRKSLKHHYQDVVEIDLRETVDPSLLGGIQLQIGEQVIDHTIVSKLNHLAAKL